MRLPQKTLSLGLLQVPSPAQPSQLAQLYRMSIALRFASTSCAKIALLSDSAKTTETLKKPKKDTRKEIAKESKLPERKVRLAQQIEKASSEVYDMVRQGTVSLTEGRKISALPEAARKTAMAAVNKGDTVTHQ
jgi:hypothetical protein